MREGFGGAIARSGLAIVLLMAGAVVPAAVVGPNTARAATDTLVVTPTADAYVSSNYPTTNYGTVTPLRARLDKAETFLSFNLAAWQGLRISALSLTLQGVVGDASPVRLSTTAATWGESTVTWDTRPTPVVSLASVPTISGTTAKFDVKSLFASGFVDQITLSLRVASSTDPLVTFGSRESSTKPTLTLAVAARTDTVDLPATADTYANSNFTTTTYGTSTLVKVDASPAKDAYLKFDMSAWMGLTYTTLNLRVALTVDSVATLNVYRIANTSWSEPTLNWANRPTSGTLLTAVTTRILAGTRSIDISSAFASHIVDSSVLALRIAGTGSASMTFSSREGTTAPVVRLAPGAYVAPPPPTPSPTPTATARPTPTPTVPPAPTASPTRTPAPTGTPAPTATPVAAYYFAGNGTEHGVGLSQTGAKGRATAGQTYTQILNAYYTGVTLAPVSTDKQSIRVLLANAFVPNSTDGPARVTALNNGWTSDAFPGQTFPANSYLEMDKNPDATWTANVADSTGAVLASLPAATDVTMVPVDATTYFYMGWRDSLRKYTTYRGSMRVRVNGSGIMAVNVVGIDEYVQGVVPAEMIPSWPIEALKAQAVAARSYGAARIKTTGFYDVVPTSSNQVYGGVSIEYAKTNTAAQGTAGIVIWYLDKIANTYFFDTGGGATENNEFAWPSNSGVPSTPIAYLRGIQDKDANGVAYDVNSMSYAWSSAQFTMAQLSGIYKKDTRTNVGTIVSLTFYRGVSGRIYKVVMVGSAATKTVSGAIFKSVYNSYRLSGDSLHSTLIYLTPVSP